MKSTPKKSQSLPKLLAKAQTVFNAYIRQRDNGLNCISCNNPGNQAGHYFPVKGFSALRYDEHNVHLQCAACNLFKHGNQAMYRIGLVKKIGEQAVKELEEKAQHKAHKWTREQLEWIIINYQQIKNR